MPYIAINHGKLITYDLRHFEIMNEKRLGNGRAKLFTMLLPGVNFMNKFHSKVTVFLCNKTLSLHDFKLKDHNGKNVNLHGNHARVFIFVVKVADE